MDLRWTVIDAGRTGTAVDVRVSAPPGTTLGAVRDALHGALGWRGPARPIRVDGVPVGGASIVGLPPLLDGSVVVTGPPRGSDAVAQQGFLEMHVVAGPDAGGTDLQLEVDA
jgi:DNA segregation ATPase FtsK/SpoIIIE, S-DNA-T family